MTTRSLKMLKALIAQREKTTPDGIIRLDVTIPEFELLKKAYATYWYAHPLDKTLRGTQLRFAIPGRAWRKPTPKRSQKFATLKAAEAARDQATPDPSEQLVIVRTGSGRGSAVLETWDAVAFQKRTGTCFTTAERLAHDNSDATKLRLFNYRLKARSKFAANHPRHIKDEDGKTRTTYTDKEIVNALRDYKRQRPADTIVEALKKIIIKQMIVPGRTMPPRPFLEYSAPEKLYRRVKKIAAPQSPRIWYASLSAN